MTAMTQEEIIAGARTVAQGLEALLVEHGSLLQGLQSQEAPAARDKTSLLSKNIEMIELGKKKRKKFVNILKKKKGYKT